VTHLAAGWRIITMKTDAAVAPRERDEELVAVMTAYQSGSYDAFERLYAAVSPDLGRYFRGAVRETSTAADLVQDTFVELHRARHTYTSPLPVRPWIFGIARHVLLRHRRRLGRRARWEQDGEAEAVAIDVDAAARTIELRDLDEALDRLPRSRREPWLLHHVHGLSFQEIANRLGIGEGAAKLRSSRAMRALRTLLGAKKGGA
jgi:RNA polymerase sigma-70 factor, ECF subfamily